MTDQRNHNRYDVNDEFDSIADYTAEYVTNISKGGVFIRTKDPLKNGTRVNLRFSVILEDFETIEGEGQVVRVVNEGDDPGMGVAFISLTDRSRRVLARVIGEEPSMLGSDERSDSEATPVDGDE